MPSRLDLPRLYAILDADLTAAQALEPVALVDTWLSSGVRLIQLRAKTLPSGPMLELSRAIAARVRAAGGTFIVNDRADIARLAGADGVHVGQDDLTPSAVRAMVGPGVVIGVSTHTAAQIRAALDEPVNYLAVGPVFETPTKGPTADAPVGLAGVRAAAAETRARGLPLVAIGGISLATARDVIDAGATSVAVISDLLSGDPGRRAQQYRFALDPEGA